MRSSTKWLLVNILFTWFTWQQGNADKFTLGYITGSTRRQWDKEYSRPGLSISGAISLAIEDVTRHRILPGDHTLDMVVAETYGEEEESLLQTAKLWTLNVSAYIGPQESCVHEARMAAAFRLPMISYFCTHDETSNKELFPTFARTRPPDTQISKSVASVLKAFHWHKVAFFHKSTDDSEYAKIAQTIMTTLSAEKIEVKFRRSWKVYHHGWDDWVNPFEKMVNETYQDIRIYVVLGPYHEHIGLLTAMEDRHLFDRGEYFVLGVDLDRYDADNPSKYLRGSLKDDLDQKAIKAFENYVGVVGSPSGADFDNFTQMVNDYLERPPFNFFNPLTSYGVGKRIRSEAAYLYDAVLLYAHALREVLLVGGNPYDGLAIMERIRGRTYMSAMGYVVYMDSNGDTQGNYTLIGRQPYETTNHEDGLYPVGVFHIPRNHSTIPELHLVAEIMWRTGKIPIDEPPCGFRGELCISNTEEIASGIAGGVAVVFIIVGLIIYRNWRYEQELDSLLWKIDYKDIQIPDLPPLSSGQGKASRSLHPLLRTSQVSLSSNPETDFRYSAIYGTIGVYKGRIFAIKMVNKKSIDMTRSMKKELKWMRDLRHDNLSAFFGASVDPPNICIVTEYCTRGSLKDVLENDDVKLDNMFIASLVGDIVRGMIYLHDSPVKSHGNLKASNCLIDSRWVLKVADFGLHEFKSGAERISNNDDDDYCDDYMHGLLYRSPELLRLADPPLQGTQKGDIYSFGILLYAIHGRQGPFGFTPLSTNDILKKVTEHAPPLPPFRPQMEALENCLDCVCTVMVECWREQPEERPDFKTIRSKLRPMRKGLKPNIFDNMNYLLEKYTNNLEALVDERTEQLLEEKKKTEALLYEMLPRYVAEKLKCGHKVEAESFDSVTIYFSDIVGFTEMSAQSSPLQVVDFLNDLYTCFDSIIGNYDVYKVETIGDAYMVVSGLPIRNKDQHAGEIASMSLSLLRAVVKFKIRHRPHQTLMLRIGIHSGPVCAGVVGLKMPRYCLFGDTVNTSSRMESTGLPLKIHCSTACKQLLDRLGGYILEERGEIKIKGKGDMVTYWLVGEETGSQIRQRGRPNGPWPNRPKSSLRNHKLPRNRHNREDLASSLDSPKKLRFASDSPAAGPSTVDVEIMDETVPFVVTSKRNSCPNLKVNAQVGGFTLMQPSFSRSFERKLCYQPHRLSTTSLVEAITLSSSHNGSHRTPNGKSQLHFPLSSPNSSRIRGENPKIELSPPEESMNDCWPLLDPHYTGNEHGLRDDRETSV
ncbi:guanylate cyclase 32E-like isoform X1 [Daphnia pulex]|uniref:guanylate cyclase 32E-like isoform X1 n=1 Tax=Daphnia pulex TaxID=6669 RepID=UPI001EDE539C|nr:guanylate cyclase 32E-like isoform X1 [Daphnia pulex]XP_046437664.1 guanylate cyclase 32E-like isoform X1 [Daphnia pulex]XP_046437665.1 guanylate cyclase 32E-like isoform X1 [Daphnia pulex]